MMSHEETLHVSTTACMEQNISTQASMLCVNSVQETETPNIQVENHQTDSSAGPASSILSTMSSMKLRDIMDKMASCLFGWSWRQVSLFNLTGKDTATVKPTVHIPCTAIVPVRVQELFVPCSSLEDTVSCNQEVDESVAVPPQPSLAELELRIRLTGICDITARLCVVFRPECIVEVDCSILNFEAIADSMRRIGLPQPTRSNAVTLAIMPPQTSAVQLADTSGDQPDECDDHEIALDVSLLEDTTSYNQVEVVEFVANAPQSRVAHLELRLQFPGICDITARLYVVFRPDRIVEVDVSILRFVAIADDIREIDFQLPIESILSSPEFMSLQQVSVTLKVQPVDCVNYEMALDVTRQQNQQLYDHEIQAVDCLNPDTAAYNTATTLDHHDVMANQLEESLKMPQYVAGDNHEIPIEAPRWSQIAEDVYHDAIATDPIVDDQEVMVNETSNLPEDTLEAKVAENEQKLAMESMLNVPQPSPAELELCLQLPGICDITARVYVVFRPEGIADVYVSILNFVAIADDIREIDFQLPIESILNSPEFMSLQQVAVTSKVQPVDCVNYEMALDVTRQQNQQLYDHEFQAVDCLYPDTATHNTATTLDHHDVMANQLEESLKVPQYVACDNNEIPIEAPRWSQVAEDDYHDAIATNPWPIADDQEAMVTETSNLPEDTLEARVADNEQKAVESMSSVPQPSPAELELQLQLPGICDITARVNVVFRPEGIADVYVSILNFVAIADDIREIDFQLPIESILNSPEFMSLQQVAVTSKVQPVDCVTNEMALDVTRQQNQQLYDHEFQAVDCLYPDTATHNTATTLDHHDVMANQLEESLKMPQYVADHNHELRIEAPRWSQIAEGVYHDEIATNPILDDQEVIVTETSSLPEDTLEARVADNEQKAVESMSNVPQPSPAELELQLQLPGICDITARVNVVFRPEGIADVYISILNFVAIADDIREIDFQLPLESILNSPEFMSLQQVAVTSKVQPVDCVKYEMALETPQGEDHDQHLFVPAPTTVNEPETIENERICSRLAFTSSHDVIQPTSEAVVSKDLKGSEIFYGNAVQSEGGNPVAERRVVILGKDVPTISDDHSSTRNSTTSEDLDELCPRFASIDTSLLVSESTSCKTNADSDSVLEAFFGKTIKSEDNNCGAETANSKKVLPTPAETVRESVEVAPIESSDECKPLVDVNAQLTNNALAELVTRGIKELRKSVDATAREIEYVPLEGSKENRRKRSHGDESNHQLLGKDTERKAPSTPLLEDAVKDTRDSQLVTHRYPSDVHQALMTQTVDLLERGIVLISDDGSFKAFVNPSSACRIGWALTGNNFSRTFKRYNNDVLPQELKQKVVERAAVVARQHQDRAFEGLAERPIFTLSEIRHYDCNGDYIMEDVFSPNTPVYPFTGIQPTPLHQCFVNPFQSGIAPQGLLTSGMHNPFHTMQQYQYTVDDIEMIDADEVYMDIDESFEDVFMECEDQTDCPYCSQISLNLFASLPTKYAISRRAIYSLLDERPLNPEIPSWRVKQGSKKSWFEYNTFSFRPEFDEPSGSLSRKDRVIYSVLDERPLNPVLSPSLTRQSDMNSWFAYNTFSFKEGDLVPIGSKCDCIKRTHNPFQAASQTAHTVPSTVEPWPKLGQNTTASKSPFNTFSFSFADHNSQQESIFGESKQESVFSIEKAEEPVPSTDQPVTVSSGVSWKDFSFREDDPKHVALFGESKKSLTPSLIQAEEDESHDTKQQPTDLSLEPAEQALNKKTLTFVFGEEEQPAFPVSDDSDSTSSETESHDEDLFDLNDENGENVIEEIIAAVKLKLKENNANLNEREAPSNTSTESESVQDNKTPIKVESVIKQGAVDGQKVDLKTNSEAKDKVDNTLINGKGQSQVTNYISQDAPQTLTAEKECKNNAEQPSKLTISHPKSISKRTEPYPTQAGTGLAAFLRRRVKVIEHDRLKSLQVSTQVSQVEKDEDSSNPVPALPVNVQQRKMVSLKSLTANKKTHPSSKNDLSITIASSDEDDRKVVSSKSLTGNTEIHSSTKHDLPITIARSDELDRKVVSSKTHEKKPYSPTSSIAVPPVQSHVKSSKKKVSLKSLHQTKKEPDVKSSEMERLMSRAERKDSDAFSKSTPSHSKSADARTANNIKRVPFAQNDRVERETVSSVAEKRGKVISLRSVIQSKKDEPTSKSSSPERPQGETIQGSGQITKPAPEEGRSQLASLKSSSLMPKADSMSNSIPHLPLVSTDAENNEVVSMNPLSEGGNTETSSKSKHSVASTPSGVQKTNVVSLKSLTQATCKKDELEKNAAVATVPQVSSGMTYSKESSSVIENKDMLKPKLQCKSMDSLKGPVASAPPVSLTKVDNSAKKDLVKSLDQTKKVDLVKDYKSEPLINKTAVSSPQVSTVVESSAKKITFKKTDVKGKDASNKSSTSKVQISSEKKAKVVAMETASQDCVVETGSARKVAFKSTHERRKKDEFIKSSVSTATFSLEKNAEMVSFKEESHASSVAESSCARAVPFKSKLQKKDALNMSSAEPVSELISFKSVMASEKAVPVDTTSVPSNVASFEALTPYNAADVKSNGAANGRDDQHPVSESSNSVKPKSFQSRTSLHKRELEEMLEEDQLSDMERLRKFNSRNGKPSSEKPRKANVKPKSVGNSCDVDNNKNSEANVKLFKTAAVQDTSIAKRSSETTKQLKPISLAVDVNIVKDAKNECNAKWIPGTLEKIKPSPEGRVAVADVPKSTSSIELGKETSQESNLTPLATVKTGDVSETSAMQSSAATPNPNPLPPAEVKMPNKGDTNAVQSSRSITSTKIEPSTPARNDTETVNSSEKSGLPKPEENLSSMDLVKEPLCLAGVVAISGENVINNERISEPPLASVPQPAAENVTLGKRKLEDMQNEDKEIPTVKTEKTVEVKKKRRWGPAEKTPENHEQQNKPRRIVRNKFKKA